MRKYILLALSVFAAISISAQNYNQINDDGTVVTAAERQRNRNSNDSIKNKKVPEGLKVWTVDERFGDRTEAEGDTLSYLYMNKVFTTGMHGEFNTTGNLGAPRQNRIFIDRNDQGDFIFTHPYSFFITPVSAFHFTNTYSPITNLTYHSCGDRTNGEDDLRVSFAVNVGKRLGLGFKFNYLYGRGYYQENSAALFNYTMYGSYLGDRYQAHLLVSLNHQKQAESGGIVNDNYVSHPERFNEKYNENEIPTMLSSNWNRNDNQHFFFTHRYSIGFHRDVPMTEEEIKAKKFAMESQKQAEAEEAKERARKKAEKEGEIFDEEEYELQIKEQQQYSGRPDSKVGAEEVPADTTWTKSEYVPVTSFIHTAQLDTYKRLYQAYSTPDNYYANSYDSFSRYSGDSIYDKTQHYELKNTVAIALLEGFNKWAKAGIKVFASHSLRHFTLPNTEGGMTTWNENAVYVGGQLSKTQGKTLHYNVTGEFGVTGVDAGDINIDAHADVNFPLLGDTVQLAAQGFFHLTHPVFYYDHYQSKHYWWENDFAKSTHTRIEGLFTLKRTNTRLRVAIDNITNYHYFATTYDVGEDYSRLRNTVSPKQADKNINVLTAQLEQSYALGPLHLEAILTYQKSTQQDILPLPDLNLWANIYLRFKIAKVLKCDFGADMRWFTKYEAPDYVPGIGQYAVQENKDSRVEIGNYPFVNVYANFHLKRARFFVMLSHVNATAGNYFLTPHYPTNSRVLRLGVSWNFLN